MDPHLPPLRTAIAAAALAFALVDAGAAVGAPGTVGADGSAADIAYGVGGNVFQLQPLLFASGLGAASDPLSVTALTDDLKFGWSISGAGTGQMLLHYRIDNVGAGSFADLRFMVFLNPDGNQADFLDRVTEAWGSGGGGQANAREVRPFSFNPFDSITADFRSSGNLINGTPSGDCISVAGCDATMALQWNVPSLGSQQRLEMTVSLSDDGESVAGRWLEATAAASPGTALRFSGLAVVTAVPEAPTALTTLAGLGIIGAWWRRRRSAAASSR